MTTATITAELIVKRYADEIAYVADGSPASDLDTFIGQLDAAIPRFAGAGINGHEDLETAALYLQEARDSADETTRDVFLTRADEILYPLVWGMESEYREAIED